MSLYEYECLRCSCQFEVRRRFDDESVVICPECQGEVRRLFSPVAVIYKGGGFYTTDSRKNSSAPAANGEPGKSAE